MHCSPRSKEFKRERWPQKSSRVTLDNEDQQQCRILILNKRAYPEFKYTIPHKTKAGDIPNFCFIIYLKYVLVVHPAHATHSWHTATHTAAIS